MTVENRPLFEPSAPAEDPTAEILRERLMERVRNVVRSGVNVDALVPGLHLSYVETPQSVPNCFYVLSVGLILQGRKRLVIGDKTYTYGTGSMIVTSVDMPTSYELIGVKPSEPFVSLSLRLNPPRSPNSSLKKTPSKRIRTKSSTSANPRWSSSKTSTVSFGSSTVRSSSRTAFP